MRVNYEDVLASGIICTKEGIILRFREGNIYIDDDDIMKAANQLMPEIVGSPDLYMVLTAEIACKLYDIIEVKR